MRNHFHRFSPFFTEKWKVEWGLQACVLQFLTPIFKDTCESTVLSMLKSREMTEQIDWQSKWYCNWHTYWKIWRVVELQTLPAGTEPRTSHHWSSGEERLRKRQQSQTYLKRTRVGYFQSEQHWNFFEGNIGKTSERQGDAHVGFPECVDAILNWVELE